MKKKLWLCIPIKSGLLILYFLVCSHLVFPQQIEWIKQVDYLNPAWGGDSPVLNIETDSNGNVYVAGKIKTLYHNGYTGNYFYGFFLEKRDSDGNIIWRDTAFNKTAIGCLTFDGIFLYLTGGFSSDSIILGNTIVLYKPADSD